MEDIPPTPAEVLYRRKKIIPYNEISLSPKRKYPKEQTDPIRNNCNADKPPNGLSIVPRGKKPKGELFCEEIT